MISPVFLIYFLIILAIGAPVLFALGLAPIMEFFFADKPKFIGNLYLRTYSGLDNFLLLALPFFMLAGECMSNGGITTRIISFAQTCVRHMKGGLGHVVILTATIFGALTGSSVAATSAIGNMLIPEMVKYKYNKSYAAALTAASTVLGTIIPPSGIMLIYAFTMKTSVAAMFMGGVVPGLLMCVGLMIVNRIQIRKYPEVQPVPKATTQDRWLSFKLAFLPLLTPVIILGGIYGGIFTPTEAAAIAVLFSIILSVFIMRSTSLKQTYALFAKVSVNAAAVLIIVAAATGFASAISFSGIEKEVTKLFTGISSDPLILFIIVNLLLFVIGMFLDAGPAILIFAPIFGPALISAGVDPVHFGVVMCVNLSIGLATPPMGLVLFVAAGISGEPIQKITKAIIPFLISHAIIIFIISAVPALVIGLPKLAGIM